MIPFILNAQKSNLIETEMKSFLFPLEEGSWKKGLEEVIKGSFEDKGNVLKQDYNNINY